MSDQPQKFVLFGAGGHGTVVAALLRACGHEVVGVADPALSNAGQKVWQGVPVLADDEIRAEFDPKDTHAAIGVGLLPDQTSLRPRLYDEARAAGFSVPSLVHPSAIIDPSVAIADGAQIMAGVTIQVGVSIGMNAIINTGAIVDHDSVVGDLAHIAPGAVLCGGAAVGIGAFVGAGACLIQSVQVGDHAIVGAGCTLRHDLAVNGKHVGE